MAHLSRSSFLAGFVTTLPLALPAVPIGLVFGVLVDETAEVSAAAGISSAVIVLGGASQLAAVSLLGAGAGVIATTATIAAINARHIMYSARIRTRFRRAPLWFRVLGSYLLLDQVFAVAELHAVDTASNGAPSKDTPSDGTPSDSTSSDDDPDVLADRMGHFLGAGVAMVGLWVVSVAVGVTVGNVVPESWSLEFTVPLLFLGLLILSVSDRPGLVAAIVGGLVAVLAADLPNGSGLLLGGLVGVAAGGAAARFAGSRTTETRRESDTDRGGR